MGKNYVNNMPVNPSSGGGSRGGWASKFFGMFRARSMEQLNRDRYAWQQQFLTEEMGKRSMNAAAAQAAGKVVGEKMSLANKRNAAFAFERKRTSKNKKTGEFNYPDLVDFGPAEDPLNARWGSRAGERAAIARASAAGGKAEPTKVDYSPANNPDTYTPVNNPNATAPDRNAGLNPFVEEPTASPAKAKKPRKPKAPKAGA